MKRVTDDIERILIPDFEIENRVKEIGKQITKDYAERNNPLLLFGILRGSVIFFSDLIRAIDLPVTIDFISVSSYGCGAETSGQVRLEKDFEECIEGKDVIIVEDIIDSGVTLTFLKKLLLARNPASLKLCSFLDKPSRRKVEMQADYLGFTVPNEFLVGYGLDYAQKYRNLKDVCVLKRSVYEKKARYCT